MKQQLLILFLLLFTINLFSQNSKFSIELNYPEPFGKTGIGENFNGVIDFGAKARIFNFKNFNILSSLSGTLLKRKPVQGIQINKGNFYLLQPRIISELNLENFKKFHLLLGIGYTFTFFELSSTFNGFNEIRSERNNGININLGVNYDIFENLFINLQYDFIKIGVEENVPNTKYNTNINLIKFGIGYRL